MFSFPDPSANPSAAVPARGAPQFAIGVDVGGTKCAAGLVRLSDGCVLARRLQPTLPKRGGEAVLQDVIALAISLRDEAASRQAVVAAVGVGVAELVDERGDVHSAATIDWPGRTVQARISAALSLPAVVDADVRAAARAEARFGSGRPFNPFLFVTIGTGISCCLVIAGQPFLGAGGQSGTMASSPTLIADGRGELIEGPPLEEFAAGPALGRRMRNLRPEFEGDAVEVLLLALRGDRPAFEVVSSAGRAVGAAMAHLVNVLDPAAIVVGGGLGLSAGVYRAAMEESMRSYVWSSAHREVPILSAALGTDAGWLGAAIGAADHCGVSLGERTCGA